MLLSRLIQGFDIKIEKLFSDDEIKASTHLGHYKNERVKDFGHLKSLFSVKEKDVPYFALANKPRDIRLKANGDYYEAEVGDTGQLAKDMSSSQHASLSGNSKVATSGSGLYPMTISVADIELWEKQFEIKHEAMVGYCTVSGGMELVPRQLVSELRRLNVKLYNNHTVNRIDEVEGSFAVGVENKELELVAKSLVLACSGQGIGRISWNSSHNRTTRLQSLFSKVIPMPAVKLYLTYDRPWWEERGLISGDVATDLPIAEVTAFGSRGKDSQFATLLATFTYKATEIFEGLNLPRYPRFVNSVGEVPSDLLPSQLFVNYVQDQLKIVFGMSSVVYGTYFNLLYPTRTDPRNTYIIYIILYCSKETFSNILFGTQMIMIFYNIKYM